MHLRLAKSICGRQFSTRRQQNHCTIRFSSNFPKNLTKFQFFGVWAMKYRPVELLWGQKVITRPLTNRFKINFLPKFLRTRMNWLWRDFLRYERGISDSLDCSEVEIMVTSPRKWQRIQVFCDFGQVFAKGVTKGIFCDWKKFFLAKIVQNLEISKGRVLNVRPLQGPMSRFLIKQPQKDASKKFFRNFKWIRGWKGKIVQIPATKGSG